MIGRHRIWLQRPLRLVKCRSQSSQPQSVSENGGQRSDLVYASKLDRPTSELPKKAKVVICGGGAQGAAIAYRLAQKGYGPDTVLLDSGVLGGGTTWHSSGLISQLNPSVVETKLTQASKQLYVDLEEQEGFFTGWRECGSLYVAQTDDRMHYYRRLKSESIARNVEAEVVTNEDIKRICPIVETSDLKGGLWIPGDGVANPFEICLALCQLAAKQGVKIVQNCKLEEVISRSGKVSAVQTNKGQVECEVFVNTAGFWARHVGTLSNPRVQIPLHPAEHYYLHTRSFGQVSARTPVVRDPDSHIYFRENNGQILGGGFEPLAKPAFEDGSLPTPSKSRQLPVDWDHFYPLLEALLKRAPALRTASLKTLTNGTESFSPDGQWILGQAPEIENYFVAVALRSNAGAAGGIGDVMANYILKGRLPYDMFNLDIQRFLPMHNNRKFLRDRVHEVPGKLYAIPYPFQEYRTGRAQRTTPIFPILRAQGARFNQVMGYERAMYFKKKEAPLDLSYFGLGEDFKKASDPVQDQESSVSIAETKTFSKPPWFKEVEDEFYASRERVSVCDFSSFAKFDLWSSGTEVVDFLQKMCSNDMDMPIGHIKHTGMHNRDGGYENDCSVARLQENRFMLMSPSIQQMRSSTWMKNHLPSNGSVYLQDVTSSFTSLCVMGPRSIDVMSKLTDVDLRTSAFPYFTCRHMDVSCAPDILTMHMTHTGEKGYVLYIPSEFAVEVYESIMEAGREYDITNCGYFAMRALRIEKFYAFWGQDIDACTLPAECGRSFRVKLDKNIEFIGRKKIAETRSLKRMLAMLIVDNSGHDYNKDPWPWGGEPIYRNGRFVGTVTTTSFGFSLRKHVLLGFIHDPDDNGNDGDVTTEYVKSGVYEVEIAGQRFKVECRVNPPLLPNRNGNEQLPTNQYKATRHEK